MYFFIHFGRMLASKTGVTAASIVPNSLSIPSRNSMRNSMAAQNGDASSRKKASENVIKAKPGPPPT